MSNEESVAIKEHKVSGEGLTVALVCKPWGLENYFLQPFQAAKFTPQTDNNQTGTCQVVSQVGLTREAATTTMTQGYPCWVKLSNM